MAGSERRAPAWSGSHHSGAAVAEWTGPDWKRDDGLGGAGMEKFWPVPQLVEGSAVNRNVVGSTPTWPAITTGK